MGRCASVPLVPKHQTRFLTLSPRSAWRLSPKQDHLVCFLGGSLMLGATTTGATGATVSIPPKAGELTTVAEAEWKLGEEIIKTCMATHETAT